MPKTEQFVHVYRNIKHGRKARPLYSIRHKGRVIARQHRVLLIDAVFIVQPSGRARYIRSGHKNVHAFVKGKIVTSAFGQGSDGPDLPTKIVYNPTVAGYFFVPSEYPQVKIGAEIKFARVVLLNEHGITAAYTSVR